MPGEGPSFGMPWSGSGKSDGRGLLLQPQWGVGLCGERDRRLCPHCCLIGEGTEQVSRHTLNDRPGPLAVGAAGRRRGLLGRKSCDLLQAITSSKPQDSLALGGKQPHCAGERVEPWPGDQVWSGGPQGATGSPARALGRECPVSSLLSLPKAPAAPPPLPTLAGGDSLLGA